MTQTKTTADAALKEDYQPAIREQLNSSSPFLAQIEVNDKDTEGRRATLSLHVSRNSGVGARAEMAALPTPGRQGYEEQNVGLHYNYGSIKVSGPVIKAMKSDKGSFTRAVDSEVKGVVTDLKRDYSRQIWGTSNGVMATCGTTTTSATIVLAAATSPQQLRHLTVGAVVDIGTVASPTTIASARTITAVNPATPSITVSGATVSTTGSHFIFRSGAGGAGVEITGIPSIVDDAGALFGVDPSSVPVWVSTVNGNSGTPRTLSDALVEEAVDEVEIEAGKAPDLLVTTHAVRRAYANGLKSLKRFNDTTELKGGFSALKIDVGSESVSLMVDRDAPSGKAWLLNTDNLIHFVSSDWEFMDEDGAVLSRAADGSDAYEATLFKYSELATDQRNAHAVIEDLTAG